MATSTAEPTTTRRDLPSYSRNIVQRLVVNRESAVIAALVIVYVYSLVNVEFFDGPLTTYNLTKEYAPILLMALPMTLIIITGEIDLSVSSTLGVCAAACGVMVKEHGVPMLTAIIITLVIGIMLGAFNGFLVAYVGLPSLAVTIGTLALYRGVAVGLLGTTAVTDFPLKWTNLAQQGFHHDRIPYVVVPIIVLGVVFAVLLHFTTFGRGMFDIGLNREAAHFSGVNVARSKLIVFVLTSLVSAFAGIYYTLRYGSARGDNATGLELQVIAAVLLGGVSIFGGRGAIHGVLGGVLLIATLSSALRLESITVNVINIIIGLLLIVSVMNTSFLAWLAELRTAMDRRRSRDGSAERRVTA
jgi:rhamnose transport system permease protein